MRTNLFVTFLFLSGCFTGCGSANFKGTSSSGSREDSSSNSPNPTDPNGQNPNGQNPNGTGTSGSNPSNGSQTGSNPNGSNPSGSNPNGASQYVPPTPVGPGVTGAPGYGPIAGAPNYPGSVPGNNGDCPKGPCSPNQVPNYGPNTEIQTTPNSIIFGKDHIFHIGNGQFRNTSCKLEVSTLPLSGAIYFFQFEVLNDNTSVNINISKACGVDYNSGVVQLSKNGQELTASNIARGSANVGVSGSTLSRGFYTVYVYAGKGDNVLGPAWDIDDFVVGRVQISSNQGIRAGRYGTYR
jgi:hypothetical protein